MHSLPSVCPSISFQSIFGSDWPLTLNFCKWVGHDHRSQEIEGQGHMSRSWVRQMRSVQRRSRVVFLVPGCTWTVVRASEVMLTALLAWHWYTPDSAKVAFTSTSCEPLLYNHKLSSNCSPFNNRNKTRYYRSDSHRPHQSDEYIDQGYAQTWSPKVPFPLGWYGPI